MTNPETRKKSEKRIDDIDQHLARLRRRMDYLRAGMVLRPRCYIEDVRFAITIARELKREISKTNNSTKQPNL